MRITSVRIRRVAEGEDAEAWRAALEDPTWIAGSRELKEEGDAWVRRATLLGRDVVVKCRPMNTLARRIESAISRAHSDRQWRGASILQTIGTPTSRPVVSASAGVGGHFADLIVLDHIPGVSLFDIMRELSRGQGPTLARQHAIADAVAETVASLARHGCFNRDHKPSNLIVSVQPEGGVRVSIIDCVGVRGRARVERRDLSMLASLVIEPLGCGVLPRRALLMRALHARRGLWSGAAPGSAREDWRRIERIVRDHGDPRSRISPSSAGSAIDEAVR